GFESVQLHQFFLQVPAQWLLLFDCRLHSLSVYLRVTWFAAPDIGYSCGDWPFPGKLMAQMTQKKPLITLATDFGLQDPFVGVMKGVIAGICPAAHVIDITHAVEAFSVLDGALALWQSWRYFPAETVHVVVVDPGVGSE